MMKEAFFFFFFFFLDADTWQGGVVPDLQGPQDLEHCQLDSWHIREHPLAARDGDIHPCCFPHPGNIPPSQVALLLQSSHPLGGGSERRPPQAGK